MEILDVREEGCVPPCARTAPPSQGSQSEGRRYVPLQTGFQKNHSFGHSVGPKFIVWWGSLGLRWILPSLTYAEGFCLPEPSRPLFQGKTRVVGSAEGGNWLAVETWNKANLQVSWLLQLIPGSAWERASMSKLPLPKGQCCKEKKVSEGSARIPMCVCKACSVLNCSSSEVALLLVKCHRDVTHFGYFSLCKASGYELPSQTPDFTGRLSEG